MSEHQPSQEYPTAFPPQGIVPPPETPGFPQETAMHPASPITPAAPKGFAITGMVVGLLSVIMCFIPVWGQLISTVAIVFSIIALVKKQPRGLGLTGVIAGSAGLALGIALWVVLLTVAGGQLSVRLSADSVTPQLSTHSSEQPRATRP